MRTLVLTILLLVIFNIVIILGQENNQKTFKEEDRLNNFALGKLTDLITTAYWSHTDSNGCDFHCRVGNLNFEFIGENLYYGPCDIRKAITAWENSPTHEKNLNSMYNKGVILIAPKDETSCYIVMDIAK